MEWHRNPEDIPLCNSCRVLGEMARELGLNTELSTCDWAVTMQTKDNEGNIKVESACGKDFVPTELMRTQNLSKTATNTAGKARDASLKLGKALGEDQTRVQKLLGMIVGLAVGPHRANQIMSAELAKDEKRIGDGS